MTGEAGLAVYRLPAERWRELYWLTAREGIEVAASPVPGGSFKERVRRLVYGTS